MHPCSTLQIKSRHCAAFTVVILSSLQCQNKQKNASKTGSCSNSRSHHNHQCDKPTIKKTSFGSLSVLYNTGKPSLNVKLSLSHALMITAHITTHRSKACLVDRHTFVLATFAEPSAHADLPTCYNGWHLV